MIGAGAGTEAGNVRVLITNGGNHTPDSWATLTVGQLFECDDEISDKRREYADDLRVKARSVLREAFASVRADASEAVLWRDARAAHAVLLRFSAGTPWQPAFQHSRIAAVMQDVIYRNLRTAADLAVRWE